MKLFEFYPTQQFTGQRQIGHERDAEMKWHQQDSSTRMPSSTKQYYVLAKNTNKKYGPFADEAKAYQFVGARKDVQPATVIVGNA